MDTLHKKAQIETVALTFCMPVQCNYARYFVPADWISSV